MTLFGRAASFDITPLSGVILGASGHPDLVVERVDDALEANVIVLESANRRRICIISIDTLYVGHELMASLQYELRAFVDSDDLFLLASHTHHAPMLDSTKPALGRVQTEYLSSVVMRITTGVRDLMHQPPVPLTAYSGSAEHELSVSRRRRRLISVSKGRLRVGTVDMAPDLKRSIDKTVSRIQLRKRTGEIFAEIWSVAIHPTGFPVHDAVSADFPGYVRRQLRQGVAGDLPIVFAQGFSGDVRPTSGTEKASLSSLLRGRRFRAFDLPTYFEWADSLATIVCSVKLCENVDSDVSSSCVSVGRDELFQMDSGPTTGKIRSVRIGSTVLICFPGEVVSDYANTLAMPSGDPSTVLGVGCSDHVWGYVPTRAMLNEGGYEACGFCSTFGVRKVNPKIEATVRAGLRSALLALESAE